MDNIIYNFCCSDDTKYVNTLLSNFDDIDILYKNGILFDIAIGNKNTEICKSLLEYFEEKQFAVKNDRYEKAKEKLIEILENAIDDLDIPLEMKEVLSPYINFDNSFDEDRLNNLSLDEFIVPYEYEEEKEITLAGEKTKSTDSDDHANTSTEYFLD